MVLFRDIIRDFLGKEGAQVAQQSLDDEKVKDKASELSKAVIKDLLNDSNTITTSQQFLVALFSKKETHDLFINVVVQVLSDPVTMQKAEHFSKETVRIVLADPQLQTWLTQTVVQVINRPETQKVVTELLNRLTEDPAVKSYMAQFFKSVLSSKEVTGQAEHAVQNIISSEEVIELGKEYVTKIINDPQVQKNAGDALWKAIKIAMLPTLFSKTTPNHNPVGEENSKIRNNENNSIEAIQVSQ